MDGLMGDQGDVLRVVEAGLLAGIRPAWTVAGCSLAIGFGLVPDEGSIAWLGHPIAMALCVGFAIVEWMHARDSQASAVSVLGFARSGIALAAALAAVATMAGIEGLEVGPLEYAAGGGGAALLATVRNSVRDRLAELTQSAASAWLARLEDGGFVLFATFIVVMPILPAIALLVLGLFSVVGFALALVADRNQRRPCSSCGHAARYEAVRCPSCQARLDPRAWLEPPPRLSSRVAHLFPTESPEREARP